MNPAAVSLARRSDSLPSAAMQNGREYIAAAYGNLRGLDAYQLFLVDHRSINNNIDGAASFQWGLAQAFNVAPGRSSSRPRGHRARLTRKPTIPGLSTPWTASGQRPEARCQPDGVRLCDAGNQFGMARILPPAVHRLARGVRTANGAELARHLRAARLHPAPKAGGAAAWAAHADDGASTIRSIAGALGESRVHDYDDLRGLGRRTPSRGQRQLLGNVIYLGDSVVGRSRFQA